MTPDHILNEAPNYSVVEAAQYLRLQPSELRRWIAEGMIRAPQGGLSFLNLLEFHVLKGLRRGTGLPMQRIRKALEEYGKTENSARPLLDERLETDGLHLFLHDQNDYVNLNRSRQMGLPQILSSYLRRIDRLEGGRLTFFPFISSQDLEDSRTIQMSPAVAFGRPVLANTGIAVDVITGRFQARDSLSALAQEYGVPIEMMEDALRWGLPLLHAA